MNQKKLKKRIPKSDSLTDKKVNRLDLIIKKDNIQSIQKVENQLRQILNKKKRTDI